MLSGPRHQCVPALLSRYGEDGVPTTYPGSLLIAMTLLGSDEGSARGVEFVRRGVEPTENCEQIELLCAWPERRDYVLIRPSMLFGSPASGREGDRFAGATTARMATGS